MSYDLVIVGIGGVGSAAMYHAARRGLNVLGIDRHDPPHEFGSSHGQSRIIRQAYFEHPDYVPLLKQSYELWDELESEIGTQLFFKQGILEGGFADGPIVPPIIECARQHSLDVEVMTAAESNRRFPMFHVPEDQECVFESNAGYLMVENCVAAHIQLACRYGASQLSNTIVHSIEPGGDGIEIVTDKEEIRCNQAIITGGAWATQLISGLSIMEVKRKHLYWFDCEEAAFREDNGCPAYFFETRDGYFYGFPQIDMDGCKVARHSGGDRVDNPSGLNREIDNDDFQKVENFLQSYLKTGKRSLRNHSVCMYTMTPDEHFIVDLLSGSENIALAAGLSGHGFKFTPVLGRYLVDLLDGKTAREFEFLKADRFI